MTCVNQLLEITLADPSGALIFRTSNGPAPLFEPEEDDLADSSEAGNGCGRDIDLTGLIHATNEASIAAVVNL